MRLPAVALVAALVPSPPALAQSGPVGIGFAQAEEGTWWCRDADAGKALACAIDKCRSESGGQECHATRWCLPPGWSGLMTVWLPEFHNTIPLCGVSGEAALVAAFEALCDGSAEFTRCDLTTIVDPDGNARAIEGASWPGPAIREPETPTPPIGQSPQ